MGAGYSGSSLCIDDFSLPRYPRPVFGCTRTGFRASSGASGGSLADGHCPTDPKVPDGLPGFSDGIVLVDAIERGIRIARAG